MVMALPERGYTRCGLSRGESRFRGLQRFGVHVRNDNRDRIPPLVRLKAVCGPGDDGEPVLTVMVSDED
jgi:hypothetical protein